MVNKNEELLKVIEEKRVELIVVVEKYGPLSETSIKCSQELDLLIINYQKLLAFPTFP